MAKTVAKTQYFSQFVDIFGNEVKQWFTRIGLRPIGEQHIFHTFSLENNQDNISSTFLKTVKNCRSLMLKKQMKTHCNSSFAHFRGEII